MVHRNSGKRDGRIIYSLPKVQPLFQVIKKQAVEKDGQRQTQQGADQVVPKLDAGYGEGVVQRGAVWKRVRANTTLRIGCASRWRRMRAMIGLSS